MAISGMFDILENCMARDKAFYDGHAVAAVAAIDADTARKALKLIKVDYEILPHVTDVDEAIKPSAPGPAQATSSPKASSPSRRNRPTSPSVPNSVMAMSSRVSRKPISSSRRRFKTEQTHQGYIEPHACLANVGPDGQGEMWVTTQGHFVYRNQCAQLLGMDISKLRVTASEIGGGFGGKTHVWAEPVALALSRKANRPVKLVMTREEVFRASGPTSSTSIDVKIGAKKDGTITAAQATLRYAERPVLRHVGRAWRHDVLCLL